jgi:hypothetical protein
MIVDEGRTATAVVWVKRRSPMSAYYSPPAARKIVSH